MTSEPLPGHVIARVADRAGVSRRIVAIVLTGRPSVAPMTRNRVIAAIAEVGGPHPAPTNNGPDVVGVLVRNDSRHNPAPTVQAICDAVLNAGLSPVVGSFAGPGAAPTFRQTVEWLLSRGAIGLVWVAPPGPAPTMTTPATVVTVGATVPGATANVAVDHYAGGRLATGHLLARGHRNVWHVAGPADCPVSLHREAGWRAALTAAGVEAPPVIRADWSAAAGYRAGRQLAGVAECRAVFAADDRIALGVLRAMNEAGRPVPADVSIVGFDDIPESGFLNPPLTTVCQNLAEVAREAVRLLLNQRRTGSPSHESVSVAPMLVERQTVAATRPVQPTGRADRARPQRGLDSPRRPKDQAPAAAEPQRGLGAPRRPKDQAPAAAEPQKGLGSPRRPKDQAPAAAEPQRGLGSPRRPKDQAPVAAQPRGATRSPAADRKGHVPSGQPEELRRVGPTP